MTFVAAFLFNLLVPLSPEEEQSDENSEIKKKSWFSLVFEFCVWR